MTLEQQLVLNAAGALYRDALWRNPQARAYLAERGLPDWVLRTCGLGYSDGRSLEAHLRKHGGLRIAEDLGLLRRPEPGEGERMLRERFAGRIVIPELRGGQQVPGPSAVAQRSACEVSRAARRKAGAGLRASRGATGSVLD